MGTDTVPLVQTTTEVTDIKVLSNGRIVEVSGPRRIASFVTCNWLVQVPTANLHPAPSSEEDPDGEWEPWYPDSPSDVYTEVECGARLRSLDGTIDHYTCDHGHERHPYGSPENVRANLLAEIADLEAEGYHAHAAALAISAGFVG